MHRITRRALAPFLVIILAIAMVTASLFTTPSDARAADSPDSSNTFVAQQARAYDSRSGLGGAQGALTPNVARSIQLLGVNGLPANNVTAVTLTLTTLSSTGSGSILMGPTTDDVTGNYMAFNASDPASTTAIVKPNENGAIFVSSTASTHLLIDIQGYFSGATSGSSGFTAIPSTRVADSRSNTGISGQTSTGGVATVDLSKVLPSTATSVFASVTVTRQASKGWITPYAAGATRPSLSLNFDDTYSHALSSMIPVSKDRKLSIYVGSGGPLDLVIDLEGYTRSATEASGYVPADDGPIRVFNTADDDQPLAAGETRTVPVTSIMDVPNVDSGVSAVAANVTVTTTSGSGGYIKVWSSDAAEPTSSVLNYNPANPNRNALVFVSPGADESVKIKNSGTSPIALSIDVEGWMQTTPTPVPAAMSYSSFQSLSGSDTELVTVGDDDVATGTVVGSQAFAKVGLDASEMNSLAAGSDIDSESLTPYTSAVTNPFTDPTVSPSTAEIAASAAALGDGGVELTSADTSGGPSADYLAAHPDDVSTAGSFGTDRYAVVGSWSNKNHDPIVLRVGHLTAKNTGFGLTKTTLLHGVKTRAISAGTRRYHSRTWNGKVGKSARNYTTHFNHYRCKGTWIFQYCYKDSQVDLRTGVELRANTLPPPHVGRLGVITSFCQHMRYCPSWVNKVSN